MQKMFEPSLRELPVVPNPTSDINITDNKRERNGPCRSIFHFLNIFSHFIAGVKWRIREKGKRAY